MKDDLVHLARRFAAHTGVSMGTLGNRVANRGSFFNSIENGADLSTGRFERAVAWFSANWPHDLEWPPHLERTNNER